MRFPQEIFFGGLAIVATCVALDPLALRPWLLPGLPLSEDDYGRTIVDFRSKRAYILEIWHYRLVNHLNRRKVMDVFVKSLSVFR